MKKLVIAIAVMLMLAGGTVSILKYLEVGPFVKTPEEIAAAQAVDPAVEQAKAFFDQKPRYIEMDPVQVPMFKDDGSAATIMINYRLEVLSLDYERKVTSAKRQIGDAMIKDFSYYIPHTLRNNKTLDVTLIKYRIIMVVDRLLGKGTVNDALIQSMTSTDQ
ncbi:MAG TPA: hypothetical protein VIN57_07265 [Magnetovibrio sp.]